MPKRDAAAGGPFADTILMHGRICTQDERRSFASALAIRDGRFAAVGDERQVMGLRGPDSGSLTRAGAPSCPA